MSRIKRFLNDTVIYGLSTIIPRILNFLLTPLYVTKFNPAAFGVFSNLYAWSAMVNAVLAFGMETTYFRYLERVEKKDKSKVFNTSFFITLVASGLFIITTLSFAGPIGNWLGNGSELTADYIRYVKLFAFILCAEALAVIPFAKLRADGRPMRYAVLKTINIIVVLVSNIFFLVALPYLIKNGSLFWTDLAEGWFIEGWIGYAFISNLIASITTLALLTPEMLSFRLNPDRKLMVSMLSYSFPILIANISFIINEHLDKMLFPKLIPGEDGATELGIYGAISKIAVFLNLFITAFRLGAEPFFFSYAKQENAQKVYAVIMEYFVITMVVVMVGISVNIDWLKYFVGGVGANREVYWSGLYIIPILLLNYVLLGVYINLSIWYKLSDQTRYALYISGIGAILTLGLSFILIPLYSYLGAVIVTTVVYIVMVGLSYFWGQRNYPIPYKTVKICTYIFLGTALSWISFQLLDSNFWWGNGLLILFLMGIIQSERKSFKAFLKGKS